MINPQINAIDKQVGLHMFVMNQDYDLWGHDGAESGCSTIMAFNKLNKIGALVFANQGDAEVELILKEAYELG